MERIPVGNGELAVEVTGDGEPVLFIHGSLIVEAFAPLMAQPAVRDRYRIIHYHRRGYGESSRHTGPFSLEQQADDALAVLRHAGIEHAHVIGHSYGGATALQLTLDTPDVVHSLSLFEPPVPGVPSEEVDFQLFPTLISRFEAGDRQGTVDLFMTDVAGSDYRDIVMPHLPSNWFEQAMVDLDAIFPVELDALLAWEFDSGHAARIAQPVLAVLGENSSQYFHEGNAALLEWMPQAERFVLPNATHGLQYMNPDGMAEGLAAFLAKHPMRAPVSA